MGKEIRHYDFTKKPRKASPFWMWVARNFAIKPRLKGRKVTVEKIGMTGIEPPYLLFVTHASMLDFPAMYTAVAPHNANNVVAIDAIRDVGDWIMRRLGCICKRKFVKDLNLIRNMRYCVDKYKSIVCIYPEARYTLDGTTGFLPDSLGKMGKLLKVPVVVLRLYGTFIAAPQWNKDEQYLPLRCELECVATAEEVRSLPADELNARIHRAMQRDDYAYQREEGIRLTNPRRANGLHNILYQCPHCGTEFKMYSEGTRLWCAACGKGWQMTELSELVAEEGETEFRYIPDWMAWERKNVRAEVRSGSYRFEDDVTVHTLPNAKRFYDQGMGNLCRRPRERGSSARRTAKSASSSGRAPSSRACTSSTTIRTARISTKRTSLATASISPRRTTAIGCIPYPTAISSRKFPSPRRRSISLRRRR